ncbi:MAG TPA: phosphoglucosamine mutase [Lacipirellulaceae bacterium]|nr:phosphoglucosamine mutase [Lacipirellulaceae bacterium]
MANELIISVSGLRGVVGDTLTPEVAFRYAAAFAGSLPAGPMVVSRDGRANGAELLAPVVAGLSQNAARRVLDAGIAATPTTGVLVRHHHCAGGIQISASHNPAQYNGLKLFSAEGRVVPANVGEVVLARYRTLDDGCSMFDRARATDIVENLADTTAHHLKLIEQIVDVERIRARRFRVLLDSNHGSGSVLGTPLLKRLGCDLVLLGGNPDGQFAHEPEPTAENLADVLANVTEARADVGFCQDPDADRLAIVDERGRYLGEEYTLAMCVDHVLRGSPGPVVTNCSTSRMAEELAKKYGVPFYRSAVGEANVVDQMLRQSAVIGGEGNGGTIDPRVGLVRDSFAGMALVLAAMAERGLPVSVLADELPRYAIHKSKIGLSRDAVPAALDGLKRRFPEAKSDRLDGLRLDWQSDDGGSKWLLVRASNTEPIVRIVAEAPTAGEARRLCNEAAAAMQSTRCLAG